MNGTTVQHLCWLHQTVPPLYRWAQIANPLISKANFFTSGLAVQLMFKNVSGLVIEANFFSQSARIRIVATAVLIKKVAIFSFFCAREISSGTLLARRLDQAIMTPSM